MKTNSTKNMKETDVAFRDLVDYLISCCVRSDWDTAEVIIRKLRNKLVFSDVEGVIGVLNSMDTYGMSAMHWMVMRNNSSLLESMLELGADPNARDSVHGRSVFALAVMESRLECLNVLLKGISVKTKVNLRDDFGMTAMHIAASNPELRSSFKVLLDLKDIDLHIMDNKGWTCFHHAAYHGNLQAVTKLLNQVVIEDIPKEKGITILHVAAMGGNFFVLSYLLEEADIDINTKDMYGKTPLHYAVSNNRMDCVQLLINKNADKNIEDNEGLKPRQHTSVEEIRDLFSYETAELKLPDLTFSQVKSEIEIDDNYNCNFKFSLRDQNQKPLVRETGYTVRIVNRDDITDVIVPEVHMKEKGTYKVSFLPYIEGTYSVTVKFYGKTLAGCPFKIKVTPTMLKSLSLLKSKKIKKKSRRRQSARAMPKMSRGLTTTIGTATGKVKIATRDKNKRLGQSMAVLEKENKHFELQLENLNGVLGESESFLEDKYDHLNAILKEIETITHQTEVARDTMNYTIEQYHALEGKNQKSIGTLRNEMTKLKCSKCNINERDTILLPCSHLLFCSSCAETTACFCGKSNYGYVRVNY